MITNKSTSTENAAVAILNYNGLDLLKKYLPDVIRYSIEADVVVIDNGSTDGSVRYLESLGETIRIISFDENHGFAGGYNLGIKALGSYKYTLLLNSDVRVTEGWLSPLIKKMEGDTDIGCLQPKILSDNHPDTFEYAGASGGFMGAWGYPYCRGRIMDVVEIDHGQYDNEVQIDWASGAAMMVRTDLFLSLDGFDATYFAHQEEIDFCWRLRRAGYSIKVVPSSIVYHVGGGTLNYQSSRKTYLNFRNNMSTLIKNETAIKLFWLVPLRMILDGLACFLFMAKGQFSNALSVKKAWFATLFSLPKKIKARNNYLGLILSQRASKNSNRPRLSDRKHILVAYYLLGKKRYSEL